MTVATPVLTKQGAPAAPVNVRWWLRNYAYHPDTAMADDEVLCWLQRWSLPLIEITPAVLEKLLVGSASLRRVVKFERGDRALHAVLPIIVNHGVAKLSDIAGVELRVEFLFNHHSQRPPNAGNNYLET